MELRQLEYFIAVAEELHFGHAATRLQMTQPPLSQQILQLEKELGVKLFKRSNRHVELTDAGEVFLQEVRDVLARLERAKVAAARAQMGMIGRLVLGFVGSATYDILPIIVRAFQEKFPLVDLVLREMSTPLQIEALHSQDIDIGFVRTPVLDPLVSFLPVHQEACVAVVPKSHPITRLTSVSMDDLSAEQFVLVGREVWPSLYDDILAQCRIAGFSPTIRQEVKEVQTVIGLVAAGLGVSIVPRSTWNLHVRNVTYIQISGAAPRVEMSIAWRTDKESNTINHFLDIATGILK